MKTNDTTPQNSAGSPDEAAVVGQLSGQLQQRGYRVIDEDRLQDLDARLEEIEDDVDPDAAHALREARQLIYGVKGGLYRD